MRAVRNPPNPFDSQYRELLEPAPRASMEVFEDSSREILSRNHSPDLSFRWSVNPYRGCFHACAYCYARPTHEYWGLGAGTDFDTKLIVKPDAPTRLREAFLRPSWRGELVVFSGNTDCYQPLEACYGVTRRCLEVCAEFRNPVAIITKGTLVVRDLEVLRDLHRLASVTVYLSIPFADAGTARKMEPAAPSPEKRFETLTALSRAGLSTGVSLAPVIPGLNDHDIPELLQRARAAGATEAFMTLLRLPGSTAKIFEERLFAAFPDRAKKILHRIQSTRGGPISESRFFDRQTGHGADWETIRQLFAVAYRRAGFPPHQPQIVPDTFQRPENGQTRLF